MARNATAQNPSSPNSGSSASGFTLVELLVFIVIAGILLTLAVSIVFSSRNVVVLDQGRLSLNQNVRNAIDVIGNEVRQAGEDLPSLFPAVEIIDGAGAPDTLVVRANEANVALTVCQPATAGSGTILIRDSGTGCDATDLDANGLPDTYDQLVAEVGGTGFEAYIVDLTGSTGEFITVTGSLAGNQSFLTVTDLGADFPQNSAIYVITERSFLVNAGDLQLSLNGAAGQTVMTGVDGFEVVVTVVDDNGTAPTNDDFDVSLSAFDPAASAYSWSDIAWIQITLTGSGSAGPRDVSRTATGQFFPRNVFSN